MTGTIDAMKYTYRKLGREDLTLYKELWLLFRVGRNEEVATDEELQAYLSKPQSIQIVALNGREVIGAITATETQVPERQPEIYVGGVVVREGYDQDAITSELTEELRHVAHLRGASAIYMSYHGDNRDVPIRVPPLRRHCMFTCRSRSSPFHCFRRVKYG